MKYMHTYYMGDEAEVVQLNYTKKKEKVKENDTL